MTSFEKSESFIGTDTTDNSVSAEQFGCCSRYSDCSDAKTCLIPHLDYSKNCIYRKALETGTVYYGKNSSFCDAEKYDRMKENFCMLSDEEKDVLTSVLHYFFIDKLAARGCVVYDSEELRRLSSLGFFNFLTSTSSVKEYIIKNCSMSSLRGSCQDRIQEAIAWAKDRRKRKEREDGDNEKENTKKKADIYREELIEWITSYCPEAIYRLCDGLKIVSLDKGSIITTQEFFCDVCYKEKANKPLKRPLKEDRRFLKR